MATASFFLNSAASLSSGFGDGAGPPGFRAEEPVIGALAFVGESGFCPLLVELAFAFGLDAPLGEAFSNSRGDLRG